MSEKGYGPYRNMQKTKHSKYMATNMKTGEILIATNEKEEFEKKLGVLGSIQKASKEIARSQQPDPDPDETKIGKK